MLGCPSREVLFAANATDTDVDPEARALFLVRLGQAVQRARRHDCCEFAVLVNGIANADEVVSIADRIQEALGPHFTLDGAEVFITVNVGSVAYGLVEVVASTLAKSACRLGTSWSR